MKLLLRLVIFPAITGILIAAGILYFFPSQLNTNPTPSLPQQSGPVSYAEAVNKAAPAVVNIYTTKIVQQQIHPLFNDPFFRQFFGQRNEPKRQRMQSSLGSGVIISSDGYLLTNNHVIANSDEIIVALKDGRESFAHVVGTDPETDLAVLKIDLNNLPTMTLASSDTVSIGDVVLAIGNPFGVGQTVTMGIVSATGRNQLGLTTFEDFIQTDAAINPGNSGGALINAYGNLIGINTAIFSKSGGSQGIGFAIPSLLANQIMEEIVRYGSVTRGWLGIETQRLTPDLAHSLGLDEPKGLVIAGIYRQGPAAQAGILPGDVLLALEGDPVIDDLQAMTRITQTKPGKRITITVLREGREKDILVTVGKRDPQQQQR
ncbi:MAG: Do family serine endopeptidase [Pseudomonadales bacterium]|jgi:serine protease DegS